MYFIFKASESAKALRFVKSCNFSRFITSGRFKDFLLESILLPKLICRSKLPEIAFTVEETAVLNFLGESFFPEKIVEVNRKFPHMNDPKERLWMEEWFDGETIEQEKFDQILKVIDWLIKFQNDTKQSAITEKEIEQEVSEIINQMKK